MQAAAWESHLVVRISHRLHAAERDHLVSNLPDALPHAFALAERPDGADAVLDVQPYADVVETPVQRHQFEALPVTLDDFRWSQLSGSCGHWRPLAADRRGQGADVLRPGATAAANDVHAEVGQFPEPFRHVFRRFGIDNLTARAWPGFRRWSG